MAFVLLGAALLLLSFWGLGWDIGFIAQPFCAWVWWSYLLVLDGIVLLFKGLGFHHGRYLRRAGIASLRDLAEAQPLLLFDALKRIQGADVFPPLRMGMVRVWVKGARER